MTKQVVRRSAESSVFQKQRVQEVMDAFRQFMFTHVYMSKALEPDRTRAMHVVKNLFTYYVAHPEEIRHEVQHDRIITLTDIVDYVAGLTDQYAIKLFKEIYIPRIWDV